jgi:hypothetical protein
MIGNECTQLYLALNLISIKKEFINNKHQVFYIKTSNNFYGFIGDKLPKLHLSKKPSFTSKKFSFAEQHENDKIDLFNIYSEIIEKDNMEGIINDSDIWYKSMGKMKLNLMFIKQILENFFKILKKSKNCKSFNLTDQQIKFLETLYGVKILALKDREYFSKLLYFFIDFKPQTSLFNDNKDLQLKIIINKIKTQKFVLSKMLIFIHILIRFKNFQYQITFDTRGRAYPNGFLTHYHPQFKFFINFIYSKKQENDLIKAKIAELITLRCNKFNLNKQIDKKCDEFLSKCLNKNNRKKFHIPLIEFCNPENNNVFESYLKKNDLVNLINKNFVFGSNYKVDAKGSGLQIITMLLNSKILQILVV